MNRKTRKVVEFVVAASFGTFVGALANAVAYPYRNNPIIKTGVVLGAGSLAFAYSPDVAEKVCDKIDQIVS